MHIGGLISVSHKCIKETVVDLISNIGDASQVIVRGLDLCLFIDTSCCLLVEQIVKILFATLVMS